MKNLYSGVKEFIQGIESGSSKPLYELSPKDARAVLVNIQKESYEYIDAYKYTDELMTTLSGNVTVTFVRPNDTQGQKLPLILYCHGGGWVMGDSYTHEILIKKLALELNSCVAFVEYPHSPEEKYPIALNQIYAALDFLYNNPDGYDIDTNNIILAGDSAGANMAVAAAIKANKENGVKVQHLLLLYPAFDYSRDTKSYDKFDKGPWLTKKAMKWFWNSYISNDDDKKDVYFTPFIAKDDDLSGLPPVLIITAENDVLRDEGEIFAQKLNDAGVQTACVRILGTCHDFMMLNALQDTMPTKTAFALIKGVLKQ